MTSTSIPTHTTLVGVERSGGVATITLNGRSTRNSLDASSAGALVAACDEIDADETIGVAVIRGANETFCSGASRNALAALATAEPHRAYEDLTELYKAFSRVGRLNVPTVACVDGAAVGAGLNLALATDIRIASTDAVFISGFASLGLHPGGGHFHLLSRAAGYQSAAALGMFSIRVSAAEAKACGLIWDEVERTCLEATLADLTRHLAADPALARAVKATLRLTTDSADAWAAATEVERARQMWSITRPTPAIQDPPAMPTSTREQK